MKFSSYLAAAAIMSGVQASPHPAPQQQQLLGVPSSPFQPSYSQADLDDIISSSPLLSFHRDLVKIESISGNEHDVGLFVAQFLEARNFTVIKQEVPPVKGQENTKTRYNIYAIPKSYTQSPSILLTSHIDTVPPFIPYSVHQPEDSLPTFDPEDLILAGRASVDAKGSVAAQIFATLETLDSQPDAKLGLLFVVGEEIGGDGMKVFSDSSLNSQSALKTVIFGEPTEAALVAGHKGMIGFKVLAHGSAAHSGYPWLGKSAVSAILPALSRIDVLGDIPVEEGGLPASPKYGPTTLNIGVIRAGVATNVVPSEAWADVAVRLAAGTPAEAREIVQRAVDEAVRDVEAEVVLDFVSHGESYPPQDLDVDVDGFDVTTVNYGTDVPNLVVGPGVKRYLYGPGSIFVAHGDNEALTIRQMKEAVVGCKKLIEAALEREEKGEVAV
ncbi:Peptidase, putative [Penicillium digitatum]|uniref:Peptidase, putative n=3 Tax=Penicillium digitatum TaxID=36651 RepID=K9G9N7_PEND2|nr:Peptidase, putative [Penicillium digitatum Pd1]EKV08457.1 Peptidase, putative [Penicillium digitatum Pd1]EKV09966.1 Peptidase, putative [Penicillium digitatum PHI26]QQK41708.1 Peptidase, putative [Penicillium digitatum]